MNIITKNSIIYFAVINCYEVTICQVKLSKVTTPFLFSFKRMGKRGRASEVTVLGIGHSVIRGSGFPANRSMVRRELYCLLA